MDYEPLRRGFAEFVGTFTLVFIGAGSILTIAKALAPAIVNTQALDVYGGLTLVGVALAHGLAIAVMVSAVGHISGAHFNPAVTLADASQGGLSWSDVPAYLIAQIVGAFAGAAAAHVMFELPVFFASQHVRSGPAQMFSEFVATFGLLAVIWGCARTRSPIVPFAVAAYITAAYWFTASTSFANPAVTLARAASDTFAGIRPMDAPGFIVAQLLGAAAATGLFRWLVPSLPATASDVVVRTQ
jgi:glycerol uptake facilitator-like aquaporin